MSKGVSACEVFHPSAVDSTTDSLRLIGWSRNLTDTSTLVGVQGWCTKRMHEHTRSHSLTSGVGRGLCLLRVSHKKPTSDVCIMFPAPLLTTHSLAVRFTQTDIRCLLPWGDTFLKCINRSSFLVNWWRLKHLFINNIFTYKLFNYFTYDAKCLH